MMECPNGVEIDGVLYTDAECPKCGTVFRWTQNTPPGDNGIFCPVCKERRYTLLGVVYFDRKLLEFPFTTG
ncbi:hypothetical protein A2Z67_04950 [Candidatus Woesebacteria bacterium RBG_13_36_22]|uniref:Uncharacterized protein n=1 Tax=Candidatus Woesebacteria bacterium RBG_13_36_22 TaxID=1802478 RepID=A0A1F7X3I9_9BACT|nr:MAG: hypothetical protein A2Z67_04950 [Candidatus Woesebacteria bacterium RBG_13_36_22]